MHKIALGIAVLGVAATVGAVIAVKNNADLQDKAGKAAEKAKDAAEKAAAKAKETADSLAKMVKNIGVGSCVETSNEDDDEDYCDDDFSDLEEDDSEEDEEFNKVDSTGSLRDLISPEAKEYAKKLETAFSSAFKAFDDVMKDTLAPEGTTSADEAEKPADKSADEAEAKATAVKVDITKSKTSEEFADEDDTHADFNFAEDEDYGSPAPDVNADVDVDDNATPDETDEAQISEPVADVEDSEADTTDVVDVAEVPGFQTNGFVTFDTIEGGEEDDET